MIKYAITDREIERPSTNKSGRISCCCTGKESGVIPQLPESLPVIKQCQAEITISFET